MSDIRKRAAARRAPQLGLALVVAALAVGGCKKATKRAQVIQSRRASADGVKRVEIRNINGRIEVKGFVSIQPQIRVVATKWARAPKTAQAKKAALDVKVKIHRLSTERVSIVVQQPSDSSTRKYGANLEIFLPTGVDVDADTRNGGIRILGMRGGVSASTRNGSVELRGVDNRVAAETKNGSIKVSGNIKAFDLKSTNGSIAVYLRDRDHLDAASSAVTTNGSVTVRLADRWSGKLSASTNNGRVKVPFKGLTRSRTNVHGKVGRGGHLLRLASTNGSVRIETRPYVRTFAGPKSRPQLGGDTASMRPGQPHHHGPGHGHSHPHGPPAPALPRPPPTTAPMTAPAPMKTP